MGKGDFMLGYALAFGVMAVLQAVVATGFAVWVCGLDVAGPLWLLVVVAVARRGARHGAGPARQRLRAHRVPGGAVHAGLRAARSSSCAACSCRATSCRRCCAAISNVLPLSYAVDAMKDVTATAEPLADVLPEPRRSSRLWIVGSLALGSLTLRRRTP